MTTMLSLLNFSQANNSILGRCHPLLKIAVFLSGLICLFIIPVELELRFFLLFCLFILLLFVLAGGWQNRKTYGFMLLPFLSFFLVFSVILTTIYLFEYGLAGSFSLYAKKFNQLGWMFIKGVFVISLTFAFVISIGLPELLYALKKMKIPALIVSQLVLILRSLQLLIDEFRFLPLAWRSRGLVKSERRRRIRSLLYPVFYRTFKRGKNFEYALQSRGFKGEFFTLYSPR